MAGQSAGTGIGTVMSNVNSVRIHGGISEMDTSAIGGAARRGGNAEGPEMAKRHNVADEFVSRMGGNASTGMTGPGSGYGHTS
jgi:hypothetical protein